MTSGQITKGIGSFYTVREANGKETVCKARGKFRKDGIMPLPGDRVNFEPGEDGGGYILEILPRKNVFIRPAVSNIDKLFIVLSASLPQPDLTLADKLLVQCELLGVTPVIVVNKADEREDGGYSAIAAQYRPAGYRVLSASAHTGLGVELIAGEIAGNTCCFAGQSAVGKSSLMNALCPGLNAEVGGLSDKTERGRHTTRRAQLWHILGGAVLDTPGFSLLDVAQLEPWELARLYPEMREAAKRCRFAECVHISEPDCAVKELLAEGGLSRPRYERYVEFVKELKELKKHKYD